MSLIRALKKAQQGLPLIEAPELSTAVHWTPSENLPIHRWFRYREGFSPYLLEHFPDSKYRLDPFCGCGTTLLESSMRNIRSYGIDLNPLATFITRTKTKRYAKKDRDLFVKLSGDAISSYRSLRPAPRPHYDLLDKLFLRESLNILLKIKSFIDSTESSNKVRDLLLLSWLSILEDAANVFKEGNGLKYRNKRRKPGKYITLTDEEWIPRYFGKSIRLFVENLWKQKSAQIAEDMAKFRISPGCTPQVRTGSCLDLDNIDFDRPIDLAIFSPPYANRFDYFEAFKVELWLGGFVTNSKEMAALRNNSMRNNLSARKYLSEFTWPHLSPFLDNMDDSASSVRMGIKTALQGYFHDTRTLLANLKQVLAKRGKIVIVVGNSAYAKSIIPTDVLVARVGQEEGYNVKAIKVARNLHVSSQQRQELSHLSSYMRESVVILEKN
ncbi:MAG: SAM-dependent methyltransferase [Nitrospirota bacterium]